MVVVRALPMPTIDFHGRVRPLGLLRLVVHFVRDLVVASLQVAWLALNGRRPRSAVIRVRLRSHSDLYLTLTAQLCSLVPGSVVVEAHRHDGVLYVHLLDVADATWRWRTPTCWPSRSGCCGRSARTRSWPPPG